MKCPQCNHEMDYIEEEIDGWIRGYFECTICGWNTKDYLWIPIIDVRLK